MSTVDAIINAGLAHADKALSDADAALDKAITVSKGSSSPNYPQWMYSGQASPPSINSQQPPFEDEYTQPDNLAEKGVHLNVPAIGEADYPDAPNLDLSGLFGQEAPDPVAAFNGTVPDIDTDWELPPTPEITLPEVPTLSDLPDIGPIPEVILPVFDAVLEIPEIQDPGDLAAFFEAQYDKMLPEMRDFIDNNVATWMNLYAPDYTENLQQLQAKIAHDMPGGKGLDEDFEIALYNRARTRAENERTRMEAELQRGMSKRGYKLPSSAVSAGMQNLHQATADNIANQSTEIAIERAKMEFQHVQFVMGQATAVSGMLLGNSIQYANILATVNGQAVQYSQQIAGLMGEAYRLLLEKTKILMEVYRTQVLVYETELKVALSALDAYRIRLQAIRLVVEIDQVQVELYSELIRAETMKIANYVAQVNAVVSIANLEKIKVELFGAEVDAYNALVLGKRAEVDVYSASIAGDTAKLNGELGKVEIYDSEVKAVSAKLDGEIASANSIVNTNKDITEQYVTELKAYAINVDAESSRFNSVVEKYRAELSAYVTELESELGIYRAALDGDRLNLQAADAQFTNEMNRVVAWSKEFRDQIALQSQVGISAGGAYGSMASASLSSVNSMASKIDN